MRERILCVLLFLFVASWPVHADEAKSLTAILLSAREQLSDPDFADSVVLVMNNLGPAPVGIIINKPTRIEVAQLFPEVKRLGQLHDKVYFGGPLDIRTVWFLFRATALRQHAIHVCDDIYLSANKQLLLQLLGREKPMDGLRIFIGHAGWGPGQLEAEIAGQDWTLGRAESKEIFNGKSEHPWPAPHVPKSNT
jgi:putative transcriptional regulator